MRNVIVTGGLGFIGSHLIKELLTSTSDTHVINVDKCTYAAVDGARFTSSFKPYYSPQLYSQLLRFNGRHVWIGADVGDSITMKRIFDCYDPDAIIHLAAESHVDRAIDNAQPFLNTNIIGTHTLLEACKNHPHGVDFVYVSTDEVYGPYPYPGVCAGFSEEDRLRPGNPYAATKAAAEHLVTAYQNTYGLVAAITRGCNTYGPYQHPEKFLPLCIMNADEDKPLPLYGDGRQEREWIHVKDHVRAILYLLDTADNGTVRNISSNERHTNLLVAETICDLMHKPNLIRHVADRPGHDRAYAVSPGQLLVDGWRPSQPKLLDDGLQETIDWYTSDEGRAWCRLAGDTSRKRRGLMTEEEK